jgi:hypothetical protein
MSDFNGAKPVQTVRDDEFKVKIVDRASGDTATKVLAVVAETDAYSSGVNDLGVPVMGKDGSGNAVIIPVPLPITDNGGSITVDASDLDIRDLDATQDNVAISDGTDTLAVNTDGSINAVISDGDGSITVDASDLDIRDLDASTDNVAISDGTDVLAVNTDGSINVNVALGGTRVLDYKTTATVGVGSEVLHSYVVTNTKTFIGKVALVGARGAVKVRIGTSSDGIALDAVKYVYFQDPKENIDHNIEMLTLLGDGTKAIMIGITNLDGTTSDVYSTLQGIEA